jgi:hypothetical protein
VHYPENLARNHWYGPLRSRKTIDQLIEGRRGEYLPLGNAR